MGFVRALVRPAENVLRPREVASRIFWQKPSHIPTYIRGKGDAFWAAVTVAGITVGLGTALIEANHLIKGG
ncbi:hypothetical protein SpCBS45565_g06674 [Spizellomyces sp. 'palustris']|nr:hypothetical protein SpCBS45565_g06674 [Spizellomyces sp. 'palustris']